MRRQGVSFGGKLFCNGRPHHQTTWFWLAVTAVVPVQPLPHSTATAVLATSCAVNHEGNVGESSGNFTLSGEWSHLFVTTGLV